LVHVHWLDTSVIRVGKGTLFLWEIVQVYRIDTRQEGEEMLLMNLKHKI